MDNLYALVPLAHVRTLYYLDVDLYRYFIGREDQSVHEAVMLKRLDQQLRVNWLMLEHVSRTPVADRRLRRYLLHYVEIICAVSSILLVRAGTPACLVEKERLWSRLRAQDPSSTTRCAGRDSGRSPTFPVRRDGACRSWPTGSRSVRSASADSPRPRPRHRGPRRCFSMSGRSR